MIQSPLRLESYVFDHIHVEALPEREKGAIIKLQADAKGAEHDEDVRRAKLKLRVAFGPEPGGKLGYQGTVQVLGNFLLEPPSPPEELFGLMVTEGEALLFGAVRELVCNLTARGPWPMLRLPNVSFSVASKTRVISPRNKTSLAKGGKSDPKAS